MSLSLAANPGPSSIQSIKAGDLLNGPPTQKKLNDNHFELTNERIDSGQWVNSHINNMGNR